MELEHIKLVEINKNKVSSSRNDFHTDLHESGWEIQNVHNQEERIFKESISTVSRLKEMSTDGWNYSGILYSNSMRVSQPIKLIGLGFYGPANKSDTIYSVDIEIEQQSKSGANYTIASIKGKKINAEKEEIFFCDLDQPLLIQKHHWYNIKFQLDGPPTCQGTHHFSSLSVNNTKFNFYYGSSQMPHIKFIRA